MESRSRPTAARRDLVLLIGGAAIFALLSVRLELSEHLLAWTRPHERYQVDELPGVLLFVACGLAWYAWRRVAEIREELALRRNVEGRLREALAENRKLAMAAVSKQEEDRRDLARELHDDLGQYVNAAKIDAVTLRDSGHEESVATAADAIVKSLDHMDGVVRDMLHRLRPTGLDELGLSAAIEDCIEGWRRRLPEVTFRLSVQLGTEDFDEATNITLYRLVQEGLTNVAKHSHATSVEIGIARASEGGAVVMTMRDDGVGSTPATRQRGLGLIGMRERVDALGGTFDATRPQARGFAFTARLPVSPAASA
jgi:two-component system sensor histidine kinase UhpB